MHTYGMGKRRIIFMTQWTDERIEKLITLWKSKKYTAREIAKELNTTRNSVLGKAHRLGINNDRPRQQAKKPPIQLLEIRQVEQEKQLKDAQVNDCRYMSPKSDLICGKPVYKRSMCEEHYDLCCIPPKTPAHKLADGLEWKDR